MKLYLVQHGHAVDKDVDPDRPLSDAGHREVERVAQFLEQARTQVPMVWHSGKTRAQQTAEILAARLGARAELHPGLEPKDDPGAVIADVALFARDVVVVGHLPQLSLLAALLLRAKRDHEPVKFQRGGVAALESENGSAWQLCWMIVPELLP